MFGKKKKQQAQKTAKNYDYTKWEADFGFLLLMINRKVIIAKDFNIKIFAAQLQNKNDFLHDKDISELYQSTVNDVYSSLSQNYIDFLIDKYFGSEKSLIGFISENVLDDLIKVAIESNNDKIKRQYSSQMTQAISELNQHNKKEK